MTIQYLVGKTLRLIGWLTLAWLAICLFFLDSGVLPKAFLLQDEISITCTSLAALFFYGAGLTIGGSEIIIPRHEECGCEYYSCICGSQQSSIAHESENKPVTSMSSEQFRSELGRVL